MRLFAAVLALLTAATAHAQITVAPTHEPYKLIPASLADPIPEGAKLELAWRVDGGDCARVDAKTIYAVAPPGQHMITVRGYWILTKRVTMPDGQEFDALLGFGQIDHFVEITVAGGPPVPPPGPPGKRRAIIVEETSQRTPQQAALWLQARTALRADLLILDQDNPSAIYKAYFAAAAGVALPALVVVADDDRIISKQPCPATLDAIRKAVAR